jgi:murein DD-endopeptidase MepM/ murein hydrolase activator NlpD
MIKKTITALFCLCSVTSAYTQTYRSPLDIPLVLSANCGELRDNHFHSGIDIKTRNVTGHAVYSVESGYISRILVSPTGYGLALYITHPSTGHTSVYGHLQSFSPRIAAYVKKKQYEKESYKVDLQIPSSEFPVQKGEVIAYSGNTGGSGGPHLHFEIRDTRTEEVLDPLVYFKKQIADTRAPQVRGVAVYPVPGRGMVNNSFSPLRQSVTTTKDGRYSAPKQVAEAWGIIGLGIKAYDLMDGTSNIYGVKEVSLFVDGTQRFRYRIDKFSFAQTRMLNTFTDFADWRQNKSFFIRSFIEPGNTLPFYTSVNDGYIDINEERPYDIRYKLQDVYGNETEYRFTIIGKKQAITIPSRCSLVMSCNDDNRYISDAFSLVIPKGNLYNDVCFVLSQANSSDYYSNIFTVNDTPVPLNKSGEVRIKLNTGPLQDKRKYGIVKLNGKGPVWIGGNYKDGYVSASINELGLRLAVASDTEAPVISQTVLTKMVKKGKRKVAQEIKTEDIRLIVTDNLSGIASFRGTVDGKFALFEHDMKSPLYIYRFDALRIGTGKKHKLSFVAIDACGNRTEYTTEFEY